MAGTIRGIEAGKAVVRFIADDSQLSAEMASIEAKMRAFGDRMHRLGMGLVKTGAVMAAGLAAPVAAFGNFEQAMIEVQKVTSEGLAKGLEEDILMLSRELPIAQTKLAELAAEAARMGIEGRQGIREFVEVVGKMEVATELAADESAQALAKLRRLTKTPIAEIENLGSAINTLSNRFGATTDQIVRTAEKSGASLKQFGLINTEILGLSAALDEVAPSMRRAGTRLRRLGEELMDPKTIEEVSNVLGMTADAFIRWEAEAPVDVVLTLAETLAEGGAKARELRGVLTSGVTPALSKLGQNMDRVNEALGVSRQAYAENTSLTREYNVAVKGLWSQLKLAWNMIKEAGIAIGRTLAPQVKHLGEQVSGVVGAIGQFIAHNEWISQGVLTWATRFLGLGAALTTVGYAARFAAGGLAWMNSTAGWVGLGIAALGAAVWALVDAFNTSEAEFSINQKRANRLGREYKNLATMTERTVAQEQRLRTVTQELKGLFPEFASELDGTAESVEGLENNLGSLSDLGAEIKLRETRESIADTRESLGDLREEMKVKETFAPGAERQTAEEWYEAYKRGEVGVGDMPDWALDAINEYESLNAQLQRRLKERRRLMIQLGRIPDPDAREQKRRPSGVDRTAQMRARMESVRQFQRQQAQKRREEELKRNTKLYEEHQSHVSSLQERLARARIRLQNKGLTQKLKMLDLEEKIAKAKVDPWEDGMLTNWEKERLELITQIHDTERRLARKRYAEGRRRQRSALETEARGTFNAQVAFGLGRGGGVFDRMENHLQRIEDELEGIRDEQEHGQPAWTVGSG